MLGGVLCATRPKPWILSNTFHLHASLHHSTRLIHAPPHHFPHLLPPEAFIRRRHHSSACKHGGGGGAALIWHAIMPCGSGGRGGDVFGRSVVAVHHHDHEMKGEGSWNVAWDARPARWLHRPDSAWLLFGVCACLAPPPPVVTDVDPDATPVATAITTVAAVPLQKPDGRELKVDGVSVDYRVTGVLADGRCLFRAISHGACLRNGEEAPSENRQRELADELRAQVVEELLKRREETEWFIEGDFDAYVQRIQQPYVWGGEPELLMASHVLKNLNLSINMAARNPLLPKHHPQAVNNVRESNAGVHGCNIHSTSDIVYNDANKLLIPNRNVDLNGSNSNSFLNSDIHCSVSNQLMGMFSDGSNSNSLLNSDIHCSVSNQLMGIFSVTPQAGPEEKGIMSMPVPIASERNPSISMNPRILHLPENLIEESSPENWKCEPIIEEPATPEQEWTQAIESDIEDFFEEDPNEIPTIELNKEEFAINVQNFLQEYKEHQEGDMSKALVALNPQSASIPTPKLKNVSRLRTEHQVYELPDSHPLLEKMDIREPDDPSPYLLAIWTPGETANSIEPPERKCGSQDSTSLCNDETCFACNSTREANSQTVRGTLLIPCRTATRGSFPLNGTYFQVNELFADHASSIQPIDIPRAWIWNLPRRTVYFGTSVTSIFKGLTTQEIQHCFWRGFVCVRGFDQQKRAPRPLLARLHFPASRLAKTKK